jgi:hypothetical protein
MIIKYQKVGQGFFFFDVNDLTSARAVANLNVLKEIEFQEKQGCDVPIEILRQSEQNIAVYNCSLVGDLNTLASLIDRDKITFKSQDPKVVDVFKNCVTGKATMAPKSPSLFNR